MVTQDERRKATRAAILAAAFSQFGEHGFGAVTIDEIAAEAQVAKGAVYHHFATKSDVFEAVLRRVAIGIAGDVQAAASRETDIMSAMTKSIRTFFAACADPPTARIFLRDGPAVLGWSRWRAIDAEHFGAMVKQSLMAAMALGQIAERPIDPLVSLLLGAITESAIDCAVRGQSDAADAYVDALEALVRGLRSTNAPAGAAAADEG